MSQEERELERTAGSGLKIHHILNCTWWDMGDASRGSLASTGFGSRDEGVKPSSHLDFPRDALFPANFPLEKKPLKIESWDVQKHLSPFPNAFPDCPSLYPNLLLCSPTPGLWAKTGSEGK